VFAKALASAPLVALLVALVGTTQLLLNTQRSAAAELQHAQTAAELQRYLEMEYLHHVTFLDFGTPPRPRRMKGPPRLSGTYYRGNDERGPELFNNGHYRTTTLHVALLGTGKPLVHGDSIEGVPLAVRVELERAPNTPDFFWTPESMAGVYLTKSALPFQGGADGPVQDRVGLTALEPMQRWQATYPLKPLPSEWHGTDVVYVMREEWIEKRLLGGRFHYGIELHLRTSGGRLLPESDLWMNTTYRGKKFGLNKIPDDEWFSDQPIPVKPVPGVQDKQQLGIDEYE
jgi:hypothetical protein